MNLVDRVKNILLTPKTEWAVIAAEPATVAGLYTGYAIPLALLPVLASLLGSLAFGHFGLAGFVLIPLVLGYFIGLGILYLMAIIADALSPSFDGTRNQIAAFKLVVYSATAQWIAGLLAIIPGIGAIAALVGFAYGAYLFYLGATALMNVPESKSVVYTIVTYLIWIVLGMVITGIIVGAVVASVIGVGVMGVSHL
jgi:hypothetical protein